jgi:hypothetical protein
MNRSTTSAGLLALALLVAACGTSTSPTSPLTRNQLRAAGLHVLATVSGPAAGLVGFRIGLENGAETAQTVVFTSSQFFDIEVSDRSGMVVWRWSHGQMFALEVWNLELRPGESFYRDGGWDLTGNNGKRVLSGTYKCRIWITTRPPDEGLVYETSLII